MSKSSFLGRDPTGQSPIPNNLWEEGELTEKGTLLRDVQDTVYLYLRVHLPHILDSVVLDRVQSQEEVYKTHPSLKEGLHNNRMSWSEYKEMVPIRDSALALLGPKRLWIYTASIRFYSVCFIALCVLHL